MMNKMSEPATPRTRARSDGARSLHRAAAVLRVLSVHVGTGWRLSDLAQEAGLDHSTAHRLLRCLVDERLALQVPGTRRYSLGPLAYELGVAAAPHFAVERAAAPRLSRLAAETQDMVFMNVRSGLESVCVARYEGRNALKAYTVDVGTRRPLCLSAGGAAILISLPRAEQAAVAAANLRSIARRGEARQNAVKRMLQRSRRLGYGLNLEDIIPGITAIGVPVRGPGGAPVASISLAAAGTALDEPRRSAMLQRLRAEVAAVEVAVAGLRL